MPQSYSERGKSLNARKARRIRALAALVEKGREEHVPDLGPFLSAVFKIVDVDCIAREVAKEINEGSPSAKRNWVLGLMKMLQQYHSGLGDEKEIDLKGMSDRDLNLLMMGRMRGKKRLQPEPPAKPV